MRQTDTVAERLSVLDYCTARVGLHRGGLAAAAVAQYAMTTADLGRLPSTTEYRDWWNISERTAWRHRERMHEVFGDEWRAVVERVAAEVKRRHARSPRAVMQLSVAAA